MNMKHPFARLASAGFITAIGVGAAALPADAAPVLENRVYYGREVEIADFPWQVAQVEVNEVGGRKLHCGGILISATHVLTAAHCVDAAEDIRPLGGEAPKRQIAPKHTFRIVTGSTMFDRGGTVHEVDDIQVHDDWKMTPFPYDYDAAILRLKTPVRDGRPIRLYRHAVRASDGYAWVSGWGKTESKPLSNWLLAADVPIVRPENCNDGNSYSGLISAQMLCAGFPLGGKDSCSGDSGGPLVIGKGDSAALVGIVSWGFGCGAPEKYGVYTRLDRIGAWISRQIGPSAVWTSTLEPSAVSPKFVSRPEFLSKGD